MSIATSHPPKDETFRAWCQEDRPRITEAGLIWLANRGMGYYPVDPATEPYNENGAYFGKYLQYSETLLGKALTQARLALVNRWAPTAPLVDVGIGCGDFVRARRGMESPTWGFDIMSHAVEWLDREQAFWDIYTAPIAAASFWDSLEHIEKPAAALANVKDWAFIAMPVYRDGAHCMASKHFRPTEHRWYWTPRGFVAWMTAQGFVMRSFSRIETQLGREDIASFAFQRIHREGR